MRCSLKVISLGKMRGIKNWSKTKKELTAIGIIIIFLNVGATILPAPDNLSLIGAVSVIIGFIIVTLCHSFSLAAGATLLVFGMRRIVLGIIYPLPPPSPFYSYYASHYGLGYMFVALGILLITYSLIIHR